MQSCDTVQQIPIAYVVAYVVPREMTINQTPRYFTLKVLVQEKSMGNFKVEPK